MILAIFAWNAALFPEAHGPAWIDQLLADGLPHSSTEELEVARDLIEALVARKREHFPTIRRAIRSFKLTDLGREWNLSVASTPDLGPPTLGLGGDQPETSASAPVVPNSRPDDQAVPPPVSAS